MVPYSFVPLAEERKEIRLLTLFPGLFSADLHVSLENKTLSSTERIDFEALSYVWGSSDNPTRLKVGTMATMISQ
jgi:hypothetical protein